GIRADIAASMKSGVSDVTYDAVYSMQPFGNTVEVKTLTGEAITRLLEEQFRQREAAVGRRVLQVSDGITYSYDTRKPVGERVDPASIRIGGKPVAMKSSYRVAMNDFIATGGEGYATLTEGPVEVNCGTDMDALLAYFQAHPVVAPSAARRI